MAHAHTCPLLQNLPRPFVPSAALTIAEPIACPLAQIFSASRVRPQPDVQTNAELAASRARCAELEELLRVEKECAQRQRVEMERLQAELHEVRGVRVEPSGSEPPEQESDVSGSNGTWSPQFMHEHRARNAWRWRAPEDRCSFTWEDEPV
jgi:hypothetical protein